MGRKRTKHHDLPPRLRPSKAGTYYYDHGYVDGRRYWENLHTKDLKTAKLKWAELEAQRNSPPPSRIRTVQQLFDWYTAHYFSALSAKTQDERARHFRFLAEVFGGMRPDAVKPQHIAQYREARSKKVAANREISSMNRVYAQAYELGLVASNPCTGVRRNSERARSRYVTDDEFQAVKELADPWFRAVLDLAYITALRRGDLVEIRRSQITEKGLEIDHRKTLWSAGIRMSDALRSVIDELRSVAKSEYLLCDARGSKISADRIKTKWRYLREKAIRHGAMDEERPWTFHDLRAKAGTDAEERGIDPQRLLGHTSRQQTEAYLRSRRRHWVDPAL
ncbi:MAG: tyrosine-type recombinase/integrase [Bacteroidota bacterium]